MKNLHAKSPCCRGRIIKFGKRRRQCTSCGKTWRIKQKKRGRDKFRISDQLILDYLNKKRFVFKTKADQERFRYRLTLSLNYFLARSKWLYPPENIPLIAVVDAMWETVEGIDCAVYVILLRPVDSDQAWILPPVIVPERESANGWEITLGSISIELKQRIIALVCDGEPHLVFQAKQLGWLIQRCHFHLIASIKNYVTNNPLSRRRLLGKMVLEAVHTALATIDETKLETALDDLILISKITKNRKLKSRLTGFVKHINDFRTYLKYPKLNLPHTSNAAESLIQCIRDLQYRARGYRTAGSFIKWVKAVCLFKKTMGCAGKNQPIKSV